MNKENFEEFLEALGWTKRAIREGGLMWAYKKDDLSLNYYFTTGTLTIQTGCEGNVYGQFILNKKKIKNLSQLESALEEIKNRDN